MKKIISLTIIVILIAIMANLALSVIALWSKKDVLTQTRLTLQAEQAENRKLKVTWEQVNSPTFVEQEARNKLFLSKPGESVVLLPTASPSGNLVQADGSKPIWQQWIEVFF